MSTIRLSDISQTGFGSLSLFLAHCQEDPQFLPEGSYRYSYFQTGEIRQVDLPFCYLQLKQAAKKEMLSQINQAGLDEFLSLKRKIILEDEFQSPSPIYCLEYFSREQKDSSQAKKQFYFIHKDLLFRFIREEEMYKS
jgi:hypothetical protein